ncbi:MAG: ANTAR domain-containing protein [Desulfarculaceae bacterium]|nr:ANTAR domain-containing protein [Desulfarculaceae bacterium]
MEQLRIALLQENDSSIHNMLDAALAGCQVEELEPGAAPRLPEDALCGGRLVLWNLSGFGQEQRKAWAALLAPDQVGLVLASDCLDQQTRDMALECGALGLIGPDYGVGLSQAVLAMAADWQARYCRLRGQLAQARQELADRELVERAKSILIAALGISEPEAMSKLQQQARRTNQKLVKVAERVIAANRVFNGEK